jgi:hypothetical protein
MVNRPNEKRFYSQLMDVIRAPPNPRTSVADLEIVVLRMLPQLDLKYAKRVSPTCLIDLERNRYSVPASFANRPVSVRVYPERIVVAAEGQIIGEHRRVFALEQEKLQGKPGQIAGRLTHADLVILDELGYLPFQRLRRGLALSSAEQAL